MKVWLAVVIFVAGISAGSSVDRWVIGNESPPPYPRVIYLGKDAHNVCFEHTSVDDDIIIVPCVSHGSQP
jgi:hypothetical protein